MTVTCTPSSRQCIYFSRERLFLPLLFLSLLIPFLPVVVFFFVVSLWVWTPERPMLRGTATIAAKPQLVPGRGENQQRKPQIKANNRVSFHSPRPGLCVQSRVCRLSPLQPKPLGFPCFPRTQRRFLLTFPLILALLFA